INVEGVGLAAQIGAEAFEVGARQGRERVVVFGIEPGAQAAVQGAQRRRQRSQKRFVGGECRGTHRPFDLSRHERQSTTDYTDNTDKKKDKQKSIHDALFLLSFYPCYPCNPWFISITYWPTSFASRRRRAAAAPPARASAPVAAARRPC